MKLCVLGLGYIGLPTAVMFAQHGVDVHGVDVNEQVINQLANKQLHIEEAGLEEMLESTMEAGKLHVSTTPRAADAFIIAVPTPINEHKTANLEYVRHAADMIVPYLAAGNLVILESTVPPRTVEDVIAPILSKSGLSVGDELFVSHSPERVLPGKLFKELVENDRIVGGINEASSRQTVELYQTFVKGTIHVTDATTAEMAKLMENTYRDVNIALANELARVAETVGFNVWEAIELANCHPRVNIHKPGPGVGGHCIKVDPWFIVEQAPEESRLITLSREVNDSTPGHVVERIEEVVQGIDDPTITIFGLAFKGNVDDLRGSPALDIVHDLERKGYPLNIYDPHIKVDVKGKVDDLETSVKDSDCIVLLTDHTVFKEIDFYTLRGQMRNHNVLDTRHLLDRGHVQAAGFRYMEIGAAFKMNPYVTK